MPDFNLCLHLISGLCAWLCVFLCFSFVKLRFIVSCSVCVENCCLVIPLFLLSSVLTVYKGHCVQRWRGLEEGSQQSNIFLLLLAVTRKTNSAPQISLCRAETISRTLLNWSFVSLLIPLPKNIGSAVMFHTNSSCDEHDARIATNIVAQSSEETRGNRQEMYYVWEHWNESEKILLLLLLLYSNIQYNANTVMGLVYYKSATSVIPGKLLLIC